MCLDLGTIASTNRNILKGGCQIRSVNRNSQKPMSSSSGDSRRSSSTTPGPSSSSTSLTSGNTSRSKSREGPTSKLPNVFSNDGSFLDRIRRSMKASSIRSVRFSSSCTHNIQTGRRRETQTRRGARTVCELFPLQ